MLRLSKRAFVMAVVAALMGALSMPHGTRAQVIAAPEELPAILVPAPLPTPPVVVPPPFVLPPKPVVEAPPVAIQPKPHVVDPPSKFPAALSGLAEQANQVYNQGLAELKARDYVKAIASFDKAIALQPDYAPAYADRGGAFIGTGNNEAAIADLTKALDLGGSGAPASQRARLIANRGLAYANQSKHDKAIVEFDAAITLDAKQAFAFANRGFSRLQRKELDTAVADATQAIAINSGYEFAFLVRGYAHSDKKQFDYAAADFQKVLTMSPDNRGAILGLRQALIGGKEQEETARIKLVRAADASCEPSCPEWIAIDGKIVAGAAEQLTAVLKDLGRRKVPVFVNSGGGAVGDAMDMGRMIRAQGLDVVVTRTEFATCGRDDNSCKNRIRQGQVLGRAQARGAVCASSCGFLIAAGVRRFVGPSGLVGVHQITSFQTYQKIYRQYEVQRAYRGGKIVEIDRRVISETRGAKTTVQTKTGDETYVKIRKYFAEMGIDDAIMGLLISAPPKSMHWLTAAELKSTSIMTDAANGEQLIARGGVALFGPEKNGTRAPTPAPAAPASLPANPQPAPVVTDDPAVMTKAIQAQLLRVGCSPGAEDGKWGQGVRRALERYNTLTGRSLKTAGPLPETLEALTARTGLICPPACPPDLVEVDGQCVKGKRADAVKVDEPEEPAPNAGLKSPAPAAPAPEAVPRVRTASLPAPVVPQAAPAGRDRRDGRSITAPTATRTCSNFATSCSGALSYCLSNCRERGSQAGCFKDCGSAVTLCRSSGTWQTTNCLKTGMAR